MDIAQRYAFDHYLLRQKVLKVFGNTFHVFDPEGNIVLYCKQKAFKIKEDIRVYTDESMTQEALVIRTQSIFDLAGTYDVYDAMAQETVGAIKRKGLKSLLKDEWLFLGPQGQEQGKIIEDSMLKAIVRRTIEAVSLVIPAAYHAQWNGKTVATFKQDFNPFVRKFNIDFTPDTQSVFDPRLGIAAAILLCAIELNRN